MKLWIFQDLILRYSRMSWQYHVHFSIFNFGQFTPNSWSSVLPINVSSSSVYTINLRCLSQSSLRAYFNLVKFISHSILQILTWNLIFHKPIQLIFKWKECLYFSLFLLFNYSNIFHLLLIPDHFSLHKFLDFLRIFVCHYFRKFVKLFFWCCCGFFRFYFI